MFKTKKKIEPLSFTVVGKGRLYKVSSLSKEYRYNIECLESRYFLLDLLNVVVVSTKTVNPKKY